MKDRTKRLGCMKAGAEDIKRHRFESVICHHHHCHYHHHHHHNHRNRIIREDIKSNRCIGKMQSLFLKALIVIETSSDDWDWKIAFKYELWTIAFNCVHGERLLSNCFHASFVLHFLNINFKNACSLTKSNFQWLNKKEHFCIVLGLGSHMCDLANIAGKGGGLVAEAEKAG